MFNAVLSLLVLILLFVLFAWLTRRAWGAKTAILKFGGVLIAGLVTVLLGSVSAVAIRGLYLSTVPRNFPIANINVQATTEQVDRGEQLANFLCAACHSLDGETPLSGGKNLAEDVGLPLGDFYPPNLTPGGDMVNWSDGEILRAIREGTHKSGRPLAMPASNLKNLSDEDAQAIIAYLRSQPAVQNLTPTLRPSLLAIVLVGANIFNYSAQPVSGPVSAPPVSTGRDYGEYLVNISDCRDCHGKDLNGGRPPAPPGPTLRVVGFWTKDQFFTAMRTGERPGGSPIKAPMPWRQIGALDDIRLEAMYEYLHTLPPTEEQSLK